MLSVNRSMLSIVFVVMLGCGPIEAPLPSNQEIKPPANMLGALEWLKVAWENTLTADLSGRPEVSYYIGPCLNYSTEYIPAHDGCYLGYFWNAGESIQLVQADIASASALPHEYLHWVLLQLTGDSDGGHTRSEWKWVPFVHKELAAAGY